MNLDINNPSNHVPDQQTLGGGWTTPFSRWLMNQRESRGLTHEDVAKHLGITSDGYRLYEVSRGTQTAPSRVKYKHFTGLSKALGVDRSVLMRMCGIVPPMTLQELASRKRKNPLVELRKELDTVIGSIENIVAAIRELENENRST